VIFHKHKCIFVHVPKTGGTTIEKMFEQNGDKYDYSEKHLLLPSCKSRYSEYWNDYFKFSIVRNPWDRIYSIWYNHRKRGDIPADWSLPKYLSTLPNGDILTLPQTTWLLGRLDNIWRYENLQEAFGDIIDMFDLKVVNIPHMKEMPDKPKYIDQFNAESKKHVERIYEHDIERWE